MLDPRQIRDHFETVQKALISRNPVWETELVKFAEKDKEWRAILQETEQLKAQQNQATPKGKPTPEQLIELKTLSESVKSKQDELRKIEEELTQIAMELPNVPDASVPVGKDEHDNLETHTHLTPATFSFTPKSHDELGTHLGILDFEKATKIAGSRMALYKNQGAKLERALIQFMLDIHTQSHGYEEILPPVLVNTASLTGTGQLPKFAEDSFKINDTDFWLSPTAEVQLTNLYRDQIIPEEELPIRLTAYTPCFRKEAGSYGKDLTGLIRLHQFNKVELVKFCTPESSMAELETLRTHAETILQKLELPYRVLCLCTGDMGFSSAKTFDLEVWFPSQNKYREISSCSNFHDFQARRAMIRYRSKSTGKVQYLHTLNGSGLAVGRTFAAILENYQNEDGSIRVPDVLIPYMGVSHIGKASN
jgi:seryl-tRNA synthetase